MSTNGHGTSRTGACQTEELGQNLQFPPVHSLLFCLFKICFKPEFPLVPRRAIPQMSGSYSEKMLSVSQHAPPLLQPSHQSGHAPTYSSILVFQVPCTVLGEINK